MINLIVGKNAVGKTKTLNIPANLSDMMTKGGAVSIQEGDIHLVLKGDDDKRYEYHLCYHNRSVVSETLRVDGEEMLNRGDDGSGKIYYALNGEKFEFKPPVNEIAAVSRMDEIQHPFLIQLNRWAKGTVVYHFAGTLGKDRAYIPGQAVQINLRDEGDPFNVWRAGTAQYPDFAQTIYENMLEIGYQIESIDLDSFMSISGISLPALGLVVKEGGIETRVDHFDLSTGMFRALSLLIQVTYAIRSGSATCIIIDDIGEGLDYQRACSLIQVIVAKAKSAGVQLIMATNDRFVMNTVDLDFWTVLSRKGGKVAGYSYNNSRDAFDSFKMTGFSNFDFLQYEYYLPEEEAPTASPC